MRLTECFSMYSDMSRRVTACSSSNRKAASVLVSSVLPTPVGPRKRNEPIGRLGSFRPARARRTASDTASSASSWPTTRPRRASSMAISLSRSPSSIFSTGTPVHRETTEAICSASTTSLTMAPSSSWASVSATLASRSGMRPYLISDARARSPRRSASASSARRRSSCSLTSVEDASLSFSARQAAVISSLRDCSSATSLSRVSRRVFDPSSFSFFRASASIFSWMIRRSISSSSSGLESTCIRRRDAASSIRSMALSGRKRSVM